MDVTVGELDSVDDVVTELNGAREGGKQLDFRIARCLGVRLDNSNYISDLLANADLSEKVLFNLIGKDIPSYTTSLDMVLPGENIVLALYAEDRGKWAAVQRAPDGDEFMAWGMTEALARRTAALMNHGCQERSRMPLPTTPEPPSLAQNVPPPDLGNELQAAQEWQIKF